MRRNNDNFQICPHELIEQKAPKYDAFAFQHEHLRTVSKYCTISVTDLAKRLEDIIMYSTEIPGGEDEAVLSDLELT
jgi:hypothetical protein